jgi:hypothetical protein
MLELISDLPEGVVGVQAKGEVTAEDYKQLLVPALEKAIEASEDGKISVLYVAGHEFPDYTMGAYWQDTKLGMTHLRAWRRVALVSDADWLRHAMHALGWMFPGEAKIFKADEVDAARAWVVE